MYTYEYQVNYVTEVDSLWKVMKKSKFMNVLAGVFENHGLRWTVRFDVEINSLKIFKAVQTWDFSYWIFVFADGSFSW